jgi:hypothetical protein
MDKNDGKRSFFKRVATALTKERDLSVRGFALLLIALGTVMMYLNFTTLRLGRFRPISLFISPLCIAGGVVTLLQFTKDRKSSRRTRAGLIVDSVCVILIVVAALTGGTLVVLAFMGKLS